MSAAASDRDGVVAGALALQRVLALEGRNALARVELAASELDRFEVIPAIQDRIATIRDAVGELDALLDKIERLADPVRPETTGARTRPDAVLAPLLDRVAPALAARDFAIVVDGAIARAPVAVPGAVLERLVLLWLRLAVAACAGAEDDADAEPCVLRLASREEPRTVALILSPSAPTRALRPPSDRGQQVELDVALAEWRALAQVDGEGATGRWTLRLPRSDGDA